MKESKVKIPVAEIMNSRENDYSLAVKSLVRCLKSSKEEWMRLSIKGITETLGISSESFYRTKNELVEKGELKVKNFKGRNFGRSSNGYKLENNFSEIDYNDRRIYDWYLKDLEPYRDLVEKMYQGDFADVSIYFNNIGKLPGLVVRKLEQLSMLVAYYNLPDEKKGVIYEDLVRGFLHYMSRVYANQRQNETWSFMFAGENFVKEILETSQGLRFKKSPWASMKKKMDKIYINTRQCDAMARYNFKYNFEDLLFIMGDIEINTRQFLLVERTYMRDMVRKGFSIGEIVDDLRLRVYGDKKEGCKLGMWDLCSILGRCYRVVQSHVAHLVEEGIVRRSREDVMEKFTYFFKKCIEDLTDGVKKTFKDIIKESIRFKGGIDYVRNYYDKYKDNVGFKWVFGFNLENPICHPEYVEFFNSRKLALESNSVKTK